MKTTIKILAILTIFVGMNLTGFAQQQQRKGPPPIPERVNHIIERIDQKMDLTDLQEETIRASYTAFFETLDNLRKSNERPDKSVVEAQEKDRDEKIKKVLSESQYEDYLRMSCQFRPHPKRKPVKHGDKSGPNK